MNPLPHDQDQTVSGKPEPSRYTVHARAVLDAAGQCGGVDQSLRAGRPDATEPEKYCDAVAACARAVILVVSGISRVMYRAAASMMVIADPKDTDRRA